METRKDETYKQVRAIRRGFDILAALNSAGGCAPIGALSEQTGVHRTTIYRILETLEALGYVRKGICDDRYHLTHQVQKLSSSVDDRVRIVDAAAPRLRELTSELTWPSSVGSCAGEAMIIEETTHGKSQLFVHNVSIGTRSPMLTTAMGRAYFAHCDDAARERIMECLMAQGGVVRAMASDHNFVDGLIGRTREQGYALTYGDAKANLGSVAIPICKDGVAVGGINVVFFKSAVSREKAVEDYVPPLRRAADDIEMALCAH